MKVTLRRTGGVAGTTMRYELDSDDNELRRLVAAALAEPQSHKPPVPDSFTYSLHVLYYGGATAERTWGEADLTDTDRALIDYLREHPETQ